MSLRAEMDALHAAMFSLQQEWGAHKREVGVNEDEVRKRMMWYAALERLTVEVGEYVKTGDDTALRAAYADVRAIHKLVSPASRPDERMLRPA